MGDSDDKKRRPGTFQGDTERALRSRPAPVHGVPIHTPHQDDFTPVSEVLPMVDDEAMRILLTRIWQHTANIEMRLMAQIAATSGAVARDDIDANTQAIVDIHGAAGTNGKLGELRRRVDALSSKAWLVLSAFLGGLAAAAIKLVMVVRAFDTVEATALHNAAQIQVLQAQVMTLQTAAINRRYRPAIEPGERESP